MIKTKPQVAGRIISQTLFLHIIKETLFSFFVAFLFFFCVFFVNQLLLMAQQILTKRVPLFQVMLLLFYSLPSIIALSAPFASLTGTLMTIGRMSSDNEVLIILGSGLSYRMIFLPALLVGIFISVISLMANDILLPAGVIQFQRLYRRIVVSSPALELEENTVKRFRDTTIVTGPVQGTGISNVIILDRTGDGERRLIIAQDAELKDSGKEGLSLDLSGAFIHSAKEVVRDDYDYASTGSLRYWVPQDELIQAISSISPNQMSSTDLRRGIVEKTLEQKEQLDDQYKKILSQALSLEDSLRKGPSNSAWNRRESHYEAYVKEFQSAVAIRRDRELFLYRLEFNRKFSLPFGALSFVFLAVSLGLMARKSGQTVGFIFSLVISFIFWAFLFGGQTMAMRMGYSPFWSIWLPNILSISIGFVLFVYRIRK
ncbi:MAG: LptF/LptG family permease [Treponema sp.]|jgi:lipopolysaccharide export system permease protein|nr:LptF/LptG family permease [Treponema sp.]